VKGFIVLLALVIGSGPLCRAVDASTLADLKGYTIVAATNVTGDFDGADSGKVVKLDNGMIFEFQSYDYFYEYSPDVIVFAKSVVLPSGRPVVDYRLVISDEDEVFDVIRIR